MSRVENHYIKRTTCGPQVSRRDLLAAGAGVGVVTGLGGCLDGRPSGGTSTPGATTERSPTTARDPECSETDPGTLAPDPSALATSTAVEAAPGDCPTGELEWLRRLCSEEGSERRICQAVPDTTYRVVCSNAVHEDAPIVMVPGSDELELPGTLSFTLVNGTTDVFQTNFYDWSLWKQEGDRWYFITPTATVSPLTPLDPGEAHRYCLTMDDSSAAGEFVPGSYPPDPRPSHPVWNYRVPALGGGEYAFGLDGWFEKYHDHETDRQTRVVARFSLLGEGIELTRSGRVEELSVDGNRATGRWTPAEAEARGRGGFTLRRIDGASHPRPLITEQLVRSSRETPLRDAVAIATEHDVDEVHLDSPAGWSLSYADLEYPFEYDGEVYVTEGEVLETPAPPTRDTPISEP